MNQDIRNEHTQDDPDSSGHQGGGEVKNHRERDFDDSEHRNRQYKEIPRGSELVFRVKHGTEFISESSTAIERKIPMSLA